MQQNYFESVWVGFTEGINAPFRIRIICFNKDMPHFEIESESRDSFTSFIESSLEQQYCMLRYITEFFESPDPIMIVVLKKDRKFIIPLSFEKTRDGMKILMMPPIE